VQSIYKEKNYQDQVIYHSKQLTSEDFKSLDHFMILLILITFVILELDIPSSHALSLYVKKQPRYSSQIHLQHYAVHEKVISVCNCITKRFF